MITYNQQIEASLFLDADGIELYFNATNNKTSEGANASSSGL